MTWLGFLFENFTKITKKELYGINPKTPNVYFADKDVTKVLPEIENVSINLDDNRKFKYTRIKTLNWIV